MTTSDGALGRFPPQIKYIIGNEACERFNYYGVRSILALYISTVLFKHLPEGTAKDHATAIIHTFIFANYFTPLLGAWLSDKLWGRYKTILYLSLVYCLGNAVLALGVGSLWGLYAGLALVALGSGGIKPCVSAFCGDQFKPEQSPLLQKAYGLFYWSINFGSFFSFLVIPWVKDEAGYRWAFGIPGIFMFTATLIFWLGRRHYTRIPPSRETGSAGFFRVTWYAIRNHSKRKPGQTIWDVALDRFKPHEVEAARSVGPILLVFAPITVFWALFDQTTSTWVLQGNQMEPVHLVKNLWIKAEQMQSMNPALVMILVPLLTFVVYPAIERMGWRVTPLRRMSTGMFLAAFSYVVVAMLQAKIDGGARLSVLWQTLPYFILTTAEVLVSATGLEFAFTQAAPEMKSTIMSFWLLTVAVGNLYVPLITKAIGVLAPAQPGLNATGHAVSPSTFLFYAVLTFVTAIVFAIIAARYKERTPHNQA
ncbi:MAG: POT family MFS transporter [Verrucomicrobiae bacterium]|nr:POT family MFS transporter [Verrucomicrobiae bacterium]